MRKKYQITIEIEEVKQEDFEELYHQLSLKTEQYGGTISYEVTNKND